MAQWLEALAALPEDLGYRLKFEMYMKKISKKKEKKEKKVGNIETFLILLN